MTENGVLISWKMYNLEFAGNLGELYFVLYVLSQHGLLTNVTVTKELGGYTVRGDNG